MTTLAHVGHWTNIFVYLAPVIVVALVLWWSGRREARRERGDGSSRVASPPRGTAAPGPGELADPGDGAAEAEAEADGDVAPRER